MLNPDVHTFTELGFKDAARETWRGIVAPAGTPEAFESRIRQDIERFARVGQSANIRLE